MTSSALEAARSRPALRSTSATSVSASARRAPKARDRRRAPPRPRAARRCSHRLASASMLARKIAAQRSASAGRIRAQAADDRRSSLELPGRRAVLVVLDRHAHLASSSRRRSDSSSLCWRARRSLGERVRRCAAIRCPARGLATARSSRSRISSAMSKPSKIGARLEDRRWQRRSTAFAVGPADRKPRLLRGAPADAVRATAAGVLRSSQRASSTPRRFTAPGSTSLTASVPSVERLLRFLQRLHRPVDRLAVMGAQHREPQSLAGPCAAAELRRCAASHGW